MSPNAMSPTANLSPTANPSPTAIRSGGFDVIRVAAALGVVILHASTPYFLHPMPGLVWPITDTPCPLADWMGWSVEIIIMPLFLALAGYFSVPSLQRLGAGAFLKSRYTRLIVPLLVAGPFILTSDFYIWLTGWVTEGHIGIEKIRSLKFADNVDTGLWGLSHLWFLPYVFLYSVVLTVCYGWYAKNPQAPAIHTCKRSEAIWLRHSSGGAFTLIGCWLIAAAVLWYRPDVVFGFQHAFLPVPSKWLYSGTFFASGAIVAFSPRILAHLQLHYGKLLILGTLGTPVAVVCGWQWIESLTLREIPARTIASISPEGLRLQPIVAFTTTIAAWSLSIGAIGWATSAKMRSTPTLNQLASASFWIYLFHHPVVGLSHIQLKVLFPHMASEVKFILSFLSGATISILLYVWIGRSGLIAKLIGTATPPVLQPAESPGQQTEPLCDGRSASTPPGSIAA